MNIAVNNTTIFNINHNILKDNFEELKSHHQEETLVEEYQDNEEEDMHNTFSNMPKTLNTYLGQKGYTILKSELSDSQQATIRKELTIRPYTPGVSLKDTPTYPVYRESGAKMYVPRYFGTNAFGPARQEKLSEGTDINLKFAGVLRENQVPVVNAFLEHVHSGKGGGLLDLPCAFGKCLGFNTPILMYDGTIKMVQKVVVGDLLMGDDSTPRRVLTLARGRERMYKISSTDPRNKAEYIVNESHILSLKCSRNVSKQMRMGQIVDISVADYLNVPYRIDKKNTLLLGYRVPISFPPVNVYSHIMQDYNAMEGTTPYTYGLICAKKAHIPHRYKCGSHEVRKQLLRGVSDSIGCRYKTLDERKNNIQNEQQFNLTVLLKDVKPTMLTDIVFVARSLGLVCLQTNTELTVCYPTVQSTILSENSSADTTALNTDDTDTTIETIKDLSLCYCIELVQLPEDDYYGFEIDGNKRFVLGDFTVTHNTSLSLNIAAQLGKKTLVIVHKEFLMNQWIERIAQFLPEARVGKIQGPIIDIENKDIVLGMLQSLSMKDYPSNTFDSFGLTIIDEVHHISSEVFSRALFKLVTKYMLGLSATMNRKDGTTKVFKMFLGDIVYKSVREKDASVIVRALTYKTNDEEFNKVEYNFRGDIAYSTMISKLCAYSARTEFVLKVVQDMMKENNRQQIMVIAHNKNVLKYMHDAIAHRGIATVGYYVGGMKEAALKETESKQIVITTYSMASEALDIKTLTTLIMVTPKTEIEQTVGRILRMKHSAPIVVDIIDEAFINQWRKRLVFYKKQGYRVIACNSDKYGRESITRWKVVHEPTNNGTKIRTDAVKDDCFLSQPELPIGKCLLKIKK